MLETELWRKRLEVPAYRVGEAAIYARISPQTVSAWEKRTLQSDCDYPLRRERGVGLSYLELVEVAVVAAMRKVGVRLSEIKEARRYLQQRWDEAFPFARLKFKTDGVDVLLDYVAEDKKTYADRLILANRAGQMIWTEMLSDRLLEFDYDKSGLVRSWLVFGRERSVKIDPSIAFGAPAVDGIPTRTIRDKWLSGDTHRDIADDFSISEALVDEALEFEGVTSEARAKTWIN